MSVSNWFQIVMVLLAAFCAFNGWQTPAPYGGAAGLADAVEKLVSYGAAVVLILAAGIWYMVGEIG